MSYISPDIIAEVKKIDLLTYLQNYEPNELVYISPNNYKTRTHDSLKISNGLWNWFSRGIGGKTALEYLIQVKGYTFIDGVKYLADLKHIKEPVFVKETKKDRPIRLILPEKNTNNNRVISYLTSRGISEDIIRRCIYDRVIFEDEHHNVIFVGYDSNNKPRYAGARATNQSRFMHDISGSDKAYSFTLNSKNDNNQLHIFEGAIDLLSFASLLFYNNIDYQNYNLISLAGVYQPAKIIEQSKIPETILRYLSEHKNISELVLHFDRDKAGRDATTAFQIVLSDKYKIIDEPSPYGKDINDYLMKYLSIKKMKKERE